MDDRTPDVASHGASYSALTFSFLAGSIAGAAAALLFAPQSGKLTRGTMARSLNDAAGTARALKGRAIRRGHELRAEATHRVEGAASALAGRTGETEAAGQRPQA
jgi:gas vesicle protein